MRRKSKRRVPSEAEGRPVKKKYKAAKPDPPLNFEHVESKFLSNQRDLGPALQKELHTESNHNHSKSCYDHADPVHDPVNSEASETSSSGESHISHVALSNKNDHGDKRKCSDSTASADSTDDYADTEEDAGTEVNNVKPLKIPTLKERNIPEFELSNLKPVLVSRVLSNNVIALPKNIKIQMAKSASVDAISMSPALETPPDVTIASNLQDNREAVVRAILPATPPSERDSSKSIGAVEQDASSAMEAGAVDSIIDFKKIINNILEKVNSKAQTLLRDAPTLSVKTDKHNVILQAIRKWDMDVIEKLVEVLETESTLYSAFTRCKHCHKYSELKGCTSILELDGDVPNNEKVTELNFCNGQKGVTTFTLGDSDENNSDAEECYIDGIDEFNEKEVKPTVPSENQLSTDIEYDNYIQQGWNFENTPQDDEEQGFLITCKVCSKNIPPSGIHFCSEAQAVPIQSVQSVLPIGEALLTCKTCQKQFLDARLLRHHLWNSHEITHNHTCMECFRGFHTAIEHLTHKCDSSDVVRCRQCNNGFLLPEELDVHTKILHPQHTKEQSRARAANKNSKNFKCDNCSTEFNDRQLLRHHVWHKHESSYTTTCPICFRGFQSSFKVNLHKCDSSDVLCCPMCTSKFLLQEELLSHMEQLHGTAHNKSQSVPNRGLTCGYCDKIYVNDLKFRLHLQSHSYKSFPIGCKLCDEKFRTIESYRAHESIHIRQDNVDSTQSAKKAKKVSSHASAEKATANWVVNRPVYTAATTVKQLLEESKRAARLVVGDSVEIESPVIKTEIGASPTCVDLSNTSTNVYRCESCNKSYSTSATLNAHIRHIHSEERPYVCTICDERFKCKGTFKRHMQKHSDERPEQCLVCGRRFKDRDTLRNHTRLHDSFGKYFCKYCGKQYKVRSSLYNHMLKHEGKMPRRNRDGKKKILEKTYPLEELHRVHQLETCTRDVSIKPKKENEDCVGFNVEAIPMTDSDSDSSSSQQASEEAVGLVVNEKYMPIAPKPAVAPTQVVIIGEENNADNVNNRQPAASTVMATFALGDGNVALVPTKLVSRPIVRGMSASTSKRVTLGDINSENGSTANAKSSSDAADVPDAAAVGETLSSQESLVLASPDLAATTDLSDLTPLCNELQIAIKDDHEKDS